MATARQAVLDVLTPLGYPVGSSRLPEQIGSPELTVFTSKVEPAGTGRTRRWTLDVYVLTPKTDPVSADDDLDAVLARVLDAIDKDRRMHWTETERGTANDSYQSHKVSLWLLMTEE